MKSWDYDYLVIYIYAVHIIANAVNYQSPAMSEKGTFWFYYLRIYLNTIHVTLAFCDHG